MPVRQVHPSYSLLGRASTCSETDCPCTLHTLFTLIQACLRWLPTIASKFCPRVIVVKRFDSMYVSMSIDVLLLLLANCVTCITCSPFQSWSSCTSPWVTIPNRLDTCCIVYSKWCKQCTFQLAHRTAWSFCFVSCFYFCICTWISCTDNSMEWHNRENVHSWKDLFSVSRHTSKKCLRIGQLTALNSCCVAV